MKKKLVYSAVAVVVFSLCFSLLIYNSNKKEKYTDSELMEQRKSKYYSDAGVSSIQPRPNPNFTFYPPLRLSLDELRGFQFENVYVPKKLIDNPDSYTIDLTIIEGNIHSLFLLWYDYTNNTYISIHAVPVYMHIPTVYDGVGKKIKYGNLDNVEYYVDDNRKYAYYDAKIYNYTFTSNLPIENIYEVIKTLVLLE